MALVVNGRVAVAAVFLTAVACEPRRDAIVRFEPEARPLVSGQGHDPSLHVASSGTVATLFAAIAWTDVSDDGVQVFLARARFGEDGS